MSNILSEIDWSEFRGTPVLTFDGDSRSGKNTVAKELGYGDRRDLVLDTGKGYRAAATLLVRNLAPNTDLADNERLGAIAEALDVDRATAMAELAKVVQPLGGGVWQLGKDGLVEESSMDGSGLGRIAGKLAAIQSARQVVDGFSVAFVNAAAEREEELPVILDGRVEYKVLERTEGVMPSVVNITPVFFAVSLMECIKRSVRADFGMEFGEEFDLDDPKFVKSIDNAGSRYKGDKSRELDRVEPSWRSQRYAGVSGFDNMHDTYTLLDLDAQSSRYFGQRTAGVVNISGLNRNQNREQMVLDTDTLAPNRSANLIFSATKAFVESAAQY
jgi:Cytidylate kinase